MLSWKVWIVISFSDNWLFKQIISLNHFHLFWPIVNSLQATHVSMLALKYILYWLEIIRMNNIIWNTIYLKLSIIPGTFTEFILRESSTLKLTLNKNLPEIHLLFLMYKSPGVDHQLFALKVMHHSCPFLSI